jgi:hypothetical protein
LELALYCLNNRVLQEPKPEGTTTAQSPAEKTQTESASVLDVTEDQKKTS